MAKPGVHLHCCSCGDTFTCACRQPTDNPRCIPCIGGTGDSLIAQGRRPRACCVAQIRPARKDEVVSYRLAGSKPWLICGECKRPFTYRPTEAFSWQKA